MPTQSSKKPDKSYSSFSSLVGLEYVERGQGWTRWCMDVDESHMNANGVVHGGVIYTLADTCMGSAVHTTLESHQTCTTVEIKISYFKPVHSGTIWCEAKIINRGRRVVTLEADVQYENQLIAKALGTFYVLKKG